MLTLSETKNIISQLNPEEKRQLFQWLQQEQEEQELSTFSFVTSHSVLEEEWLTPEEDKAWENL